MRPQRGDKGVMRPPRPYKDYEAIKGSIRGLERRGGVPGERYLKVLHRALKGYINALSEKDLP